MSIDIHPANNKEHAMTTIQDVADAFYDACNAPAPVVPAAELDEIIDYVVEFPKAAWATAFLADLPRWLGATIYAASGACRKGKVVTFRAPRVMYGEALITDLRGFVGYHSAPSMLGKVNGLRAIPCY